MATGDQRGTRKADASQFRVEDRRPVWSALSSLFLDTDTNLLIDYMIRTLSASPYSLDELNTILIDEVRGSRSRECVVQGG